MFSSLGYSEIENTDPSHNSNNSNHSKSGCRNRNRNRNKQKLADIKKAMHQAPIKETFEPMNNESDDDDDNYENFNSNNVTESFSPPHKPMSMGGERRKEKENTQPNMLGDQNENDEDDDAQPQQKPNSKTGSDNSVTNEGFREMSSDYAKQYYGQYIPFSNPSMTTQSTTHNGDFMKKLNYMIHLLEDQKDEKINGITEELVLYLFLGIFIIFLVDSFAKVGKYVR
tara:strand:+ start:238 stop:918 length:681 start_codon:yes stop_codon:yes gene_type:complete